MGSSHHHGLSPVPAFLPSPCFNSGLKLFWSVTGMEVALPSWPVGHRVFPPSAASTCVHLLKGVKTSLWGKKWFLRAGGYLGILQQLLMKVSANPREWAREKGILQSPCRHGCEEVSNGVRIGGALYPDVVMVTNENQCRRIITCRIIVLK